MWYPEAVEWSALQISPSLGGAPRMQDFAKTGKAPGTLETLVPLPEDVSLWDLINNSSQYEGQNAGWTQRRLFSIFKAPMYCFCS